MTYLEIYRTIEPHIPTSLLEKYGHLPYGEMAEVPELAQWADLLRCAEDEWARADVPEALFG